MHKLEKPIEKFLFASRWLMAPFYIGLVFSLAMLLYSFCEELFHIVIQLPNITQNDMIIGIISLIDLSLVGNLLLIIVFSGYENFVSRIDIGDHEDQPEWKGTVDFASMKLKLIASIVAISGIHLLKVFMNIGSMSDRDIQWMLTIHVVFVVSGVMLALMDWITSKASA
jgi:uncharacterized protein (TIGR00645 family)